VSLLCYWEAPPHSREGADLHEGPFLSLYVFSLGAGGGRTAATPLKSKTAGRTDRHQGKAGAGH